MSKSGSELRELVDSLHPRSPSEVMGEAANSSLLGSTITATVSTLVLLVGVTAVVFVVRGPTEPTGTRSSASSKPPPQTNTAQTNTNTEPAEGATSSETESAAPTEAGKPDTEQAIEAMGIGESAAADAEPETLENRLDQLLDGLE